MGDGAGLKYEEGMTMQNESKIPTAVLDILLARTGSPKDINWFGGLETPETSLETRESHDRDPEPLPRGNDRFPFYAKRKGGPAGLHHLGCQCEFE